LVFFLLAITVDNRLDGGGPEWRGFVLAGAFVALLAALVICKVQTWRREERPEPKLSGRARVVAIVGSLPALVYWLACMVTGNGSYVLMWTLAVVAVGATTAAAAMARASFTTPQRAAQ
jgi:hypothetical protein